MPAVDHEHERAPVSAVHALDTTTIRQRRTGGDASNSLKTHSEHGHQEQPQQDAEYYSDDEGYAADEGETTAASQGCDDCVTFAIVAVVLACMGGFFYFLFVQMTSPSEFLSQRLQNAPKVDAKNVQVQVTLAQLYNGHTTKIDVDRQLVCRHCVGTGVDLHEGYHQCHECQGSGVRTYLQRIGPIQQHVRAACNVCKGKGKVANKQCDHCHGHGSLRDNKQFDVTIERGMRHGDTVVLAREGDQSVRALPGDIVVHLHMTPHKKFTRRGDDLEMELEISLLEALVGFKRNITHLDQRVVELARDQEIVAPATVWRIPNLGMPKRPRDAEKSETKSKPKTEPRFGELVVRFLIQYPPRLTKQEKQTVEELLTV